MDPELGQVIATLPGVMASKSLAARAVDGDVRIFAATEDEVTAWRVPIPAQAEQKEDVGQ